MLKQIFIKGLLSCCLFVGHIIIFNTEIVNASSLFPCGTGAHGGIETSTNKTVLVEECMEKGTDSKKCKDLCSGVSLSTDFSFEESCTKDDGSLGICCACLKVKETKTTPTQVAPGGSAPATTIKLENPLGQGADLFTIIGRVVKNFLGVVGAIALLVFIYAGVSYMTAGGEQARVTKAVDTMKYGIIGLALIILAYTIVSYFIKAFAGG